MKTLLLTLALLPLPQQDDAPALGDRIEITFHSGATLGGTLVASPQTAPAESLTLDVTWEYPGLNGTLSVARKEIQSVRKLRVLDDATRRRLAEVKRQLAEENAKVPAPKTPAPAVPAPLPQPPAPEAAPNDQAARDFYAKYPEPTWNPERRNAIRLKQYRGQAPTPAERDFEAGFELWEKGRAAAVKKPTPQ